MRHSFASLLIHEGRSLAEVAVQFGDAIATVASTYTHAFVEGEALPREPAADEIDAAGAAAGVRQLYVGLEAAANGMAGDPASGEKADARTRTGDPFITSEISRSGGVCRDVAGSGQRAGKFRGPGRWSPLPSISRFPGVRARIGHWSHDPGARVEVRGPSHAPGVPLSRHAPFPPPASRSFGHGSKCLRGLLIGDTG